MLTLHVLLVSGAADGQLPADVVLTLYRTGTIRDTDFLPGKTYVLADGSPGRISRFLLRSLTVGRHRLASVPASIGSLTSTPLLGQSFLARLGTWRVDNQREVFVVQSLAPPATSRHGAQSTVPGAGVAPQTLVVSPPRLSSPVAHVGQRVTVTLEATNTSPHIGQGMVRLHYPAHLVSLLALHTTSHASVVPIPSPQDASPVSAPPVPTASQRL